MTMKTHKRKKSKGQRGTTRYHGARKKWKSSGHKGGKGMAGSGKRADQKKTLVTKLYGHGYFGKQGITSKGTRRDKRDRINVGTIELNLAKLVKKGVAKKVGEKYEINLSSFKILGVGEVKNKFFITAFEASESAMEKIKKVGGEIIVKEKFVIETPVVINPKHARKKK